MKKLFLLLMSVMLVACSTASTKKQSPRPHLSPVAASEKLLRDEPLPPLPPMQWTAPEKAEIPPIEEALANDGECVGCSVRPIPPIEEALANDGECVRCSVRPIPLTEIIAERPMARRKMMYR